MAMAQQAETNAAEGWADLSGRWFFAWRMAAACETALREVHCAMDEPRSPDRMQALEKASLLLREELVRWLRRGEALDMIVERLPKQPV